MIRAAYGLGYAELQGLLQTLDEYPSAIESDLIRVGLRLRWVGSDLLTWDELYAVVTHLTQDSALYRASNPEHHEWDLPAQLLAQIADLLAGANWQRGGGNNRDRPKPIPRPGVEPDSTTYGKGAIPIDEMEAWLSGA